VLQERKIAKKKNDCNSSFPTFLSLFTTSGTNRPEWVIADLAANAYNWATVALYDTLGKDAVE
jgi:hypothetical protein